MPITAITNQQELEVEFSGPGSANRMFVVSGIGAASLSAYAAPDHELPAKTRSPS